MFGFGVPLSYTLFYYFSSLLFLLGIPLLARYWKYEKSSALRVVFYLLAVLVYFLGMSRSEGVDIINYQFSYDGNYENGGIPDKGFQVLIDFFNLLYLPMQALFIAAGLFSTYSIRRAAHYFDVDGTILFILYFFHLFVVRDFAQMRIGFAAAIAIVGLTSNLRMKLLFYIFAASVHFSILVFIVAYESCHFVAHLKCRAERLFMIAIGVVLVFAIGLNIENLAFLDSRIETYLKWDREGYGQEVVSYSQLIMSFGILFLGLAVRKNWQGYPMFRCLFYLQILAIASFIAFHNHSIFAFRLSNIIASLYPIFILLAVSKIHVRLGRYSIGYQAAGIVLQVVSIALLLRPGSFDIISRIVL